MVLLPAALLRLFPTCPRELTMQAATVRDMIAALDAHTPGLRDRICDSTPRIRRWRSCPHCSRSTATV